MGYDSVHHYWDCHVRRMGRYEKRTCYVTFPSTNMCVTLIIPLYLKGWNYVDSVYFCVTSLAKIGFGDFVPGQR